MGIGPVPATQKVLNKAGLSLKDIQLVEINEAFAAQYLSCERELGLNRDIVNVNGSGIALGHPIGMTGGGHCLMRKEIENSSHFLNFNPNSPPSVSGE